MDLVPDGCLEKLVLFGLATLDTTGGSPGFENETTQKGDITHVSFGALEERRPPQHKVLAT